MHMNACVNPGYGYKVGDKLSIPNYEDMEITDEFAPPQGFEGKSFSDMGGIIRVDDITEAEFATVIVEPEIIPADPSTVNETNTIPEDDGVGISTGGGTNVVCPPNLIINTYNDTCNKINNDEDLFGITQVIVVQSGVGYTNFPDGTLPPYGS